MTRLERAFAVIASCVVGLFMSGCSSTKPAFDVSGAGFILETPNAASRQHMIESDRQFAEQVAVNRATCMKLPGCRK